MPVVEISTKGQVIIPAEMRQKHAIKEGDRFLIEVIDGKIVLSPLKTRPFSAMYGILRGETSLTEELLNERAKETKKER